VVDGHGVSISDVDDRCAHHFLEEVGAGGSVSQRRLACELGMALGLANLLVRRVVGRGWVRIVRIKPNRVRYFLTPAGFAEKARMSKRLLRQSVAHYVTLRNKIQQRLAAASPERTRVVFYGTGELAEIALVCLPGSELTLVGIVDEIDPGRPFLGHTVRAPLDLRGQKVGDVDFDLLLVTSLENPEHIRGLLERQGVAQSRVVWI